jgi:hypothetical protein
VEETKVTYHLNGKLQVELTPYKVLHVDILAEILRRVEKGQSVKVLPTAGGLMIEVED